MGKLGKETKNLLLAITVICLISFLLAAGLSFLLAKDFQHEMLLHDYGVSGYQLNHEDKLQISAFTAHPNESDIERGKEALTSIGYSEATSMQLLPTVREYRNQTMLYLFLLLLFLFGMVYLVLLFYLRRQHRAIDDAGSKIREFLDGNSMSRIECSQTGDWYSLFHDVNEMATILSAHAESQKQTKEFLQDIISDVSHQIKTPLSALKMYHEIISSHKGEAETVANFSEKSQREIKRMENVIYTLLKLARLDAGIIQMEKAEENVSALMQDVLERFETWAEQDHKEITLWCEHCIGTYYRSIGGSDPRKNGSKGFPIGGCHRQYTAGILVPPCGKHSAVACRGSTWYPSCQGQTAQLYSDDRCVCNLHHLVFRVLYAGSLYGKRIYAERMVARAFHCQ